MSVSDPRKEAVPGTIGCGGRAQIRLSFRAEPGECAGGAQIMLVLDRSCSMSCERMEHMKAGARGLVRMLSEGGRLRRGLRMGLVSFADRAEEDVPLTREPEELYRGIDSLTAGGRTGHAQAFRAALEAFEPGKEGERIVILFTDGRSNTGEEPGPQARLVRESGAELYCLGLGTDREPLLEWASEPKEEHVLWTDRSEELEDLFLQAAGAVRRAGAVDAVIREKVSRDFRIVRVDAPEVGTVRQLDSRTLVWSVGTVGLEGPEEPALAFEVAHVGNTGGEKQVNELLTYRDRSGNRLVFPNPVIFVDGCAVCPEPCPAPVDIRTEGCRACMCADLGDTCLEHTGRIVEMRTTVRNVCPGRRVALAVTLVEEGPCGEEYPRGMKVFTLPAQGGQRCRDVTVRCIRFVVPDDLGPCACGGQCRPRHFRASVLANYLDTDFSCCGPETVSL